MYQEKYRKRYPEKSLLPFHFHRTLGAAKNFEFDVSSVNPRWISDVEDAGEAKNARRLPARLPQERPPIHPDTIAALVEMGFHREVAHQAMIQAGGNMDHALVLLLAQL